MPTWPSRDFRNRVDSALTPPPKILSNADDGRGGVRVTYSLPGLRRAEVTVPAYRWQDGHHVGIGRELARLVAQLDAQDASIADSLPGT